MGIRKMNRLKLLIDNKFMAKEINLENDKWHFELPNTAGWYFIETDTPLEIFLELNSPPSEYINAEGELKKCRNYNIASRTEALVGGLLGLDIIIEKEGNRPIYSGMTQNILSRAREHTFAHKGTAGLALSNYSELNRYKWMFYYKINTLPFSTNKHRDIILKLGEQIWRANNGWPILCSS